METIRLGLIGFSQGFYATTYTRYLSRLKEVDVVACCDLGRPQSYVRECAFTTAEQFCGEIDAAHVRNLRELFDLGLNAVLVTSEVSEHALHTIEALENACNVFVGKPLSFRSEEVKSVIRAARGRKEIVLCGNPLRYETGLYRIKQRLEQNAIGTLINLRLMVNHAAMVEQEWERDPMRSGGPLGTYGVYLFDLVRWLTGAEVHELFAEGDTFVYEHIRSDDTVQITGRLSNGALLHINLITTVTWDFPFLILDMVGTEGTIRTDYPCHAYVLQSENGEELGGARYDSLGAMEMEHFVDCCMGRTKPNVPPEAMLPVTRGIEAVTASIARKERILLPS